LLALFSLVPPVFWPLWTGGLFLIFRVFHKSFLTLSSLSLCLHQLAIVRVFMPPGGNRFDCFFCRPSPDAHPKGAFLLAFPCVGLPAPCPLSLFPPPDHLFVQRTSPTSCFLRPRVLWFAPSVASNLLLPAISSFIPFFLSFFSLSPPALWLAWFPKTV